MELLQKGDRLEPSASCMDIGGGFDDFASFPVAVTFWRVANETLVHHRNPLWSRRIGFTHDRVIAVDDLHSLSLGVYALFCMHVCQLCFFHDVWETGATTESAIIKGSVDRMTADLRAHYAAMRQQGFQPTKIQDWDSGMPVVGHQSC